VAAAGASAPAKLRLRQGNRWFGRLEWGSTVVVMRSNWSVVARDREFPVEATMAAQRTARRTRRRAARRLYRRRLGEGSRAFVAKGPPTLMRAYDVLASAGANGREGRGQTDG
jgi:hypothetical protein